MSGAYLADVPGKVRERAATIRLLALDVDGTLTDGRLQLSDEGGEIKSFHALDGQGLKLLQAVGIEIALITARSSPVVARRASELGIVHLYQACHDKRASLRALAGELSLAPAQVGFMGDDLPDLPALLWSGLAVAPANAHPWVRERVHWVTEAAGGAGAARVLCDLILQAQGRVERVLQRFLPA